MIEFAKRHWMILALLASLGLVGVRSSAAGPKYSADPGAEEYARGVLCWCAAETAAGPAIGPSPTPNPGGVCNNCGGRGKVGDGTVMKTCPECNGTGKVPGDIDDDDTGATPEDQGSSPGDMPMTPQADAATSLDCSDGSCGTVRTRRGIFGGFFRRR